MTTSEPTTGEIAGAIRVCENKLECDVCPMRDKPCGDLYTLAADRLESQERENQQLRQELIMAKNQVEDAYDGLCADLNEQDAQIKRLTARAEQAEAREKAAVNNAVRAVFYDTSNGKRGLLVDTGICEYCQSNSERTNCASCFENGNFELRNDLRGLPQDGEVKK